MTYREKGILRRIRDSRPADLLPPGARDFAQLLIALMQAMILLGMAWALFGLHLRGNLIVTLVTILIGALAFLAIGFALSGIAPNTETAASYANLVTFPMLFLSGIFFSMENAPALATADRSRCAPALPGERPARCDHVRCRLWRHLARSGDSAGVLCGRHGDRRALLPLGYETSA